MSVVRTAFVAVVVCFLAYVEACSDGGGPSDAGMAGDSGGSPGDARADTTADASTGDAGADAWADGSPADAGADTTLDASAGDASSEASGDSPADSSSDSPADSPADSPSNGGSDAGALTYTTQRCTLWASQPPLTQFPGNWAPTMAVGSDGLFIGDPNGPVVSNLSGGVWSLSMVAAGSQVRSMLAGTGWEAATVLQLQGGTEQVYYRATGGTWQPLTTPPLSSLADLYAAGTELVAWDYSTTAYWFDGSTWHDLPYETSDAAISAIAGPHDDFYVADGQGLHHYDGTAWSDISCPALNDGGADATANGCPVVEGIVPLGPGEVVVETAGMLFHLKGGTWTTTASPCNLSAPTVSGGAVLFSCPVSSSQVPEIVQFLPATDAFSILVPASSSFYTSGVQLAMYQGMLLVLLNSVGSAALETPSGGTLVPYVTSPGPSYRNVTALTHPVTGRSSTELYTAQDQGVMALSGGTWSPLPGTQTVNAGSLWEAPDGTLFLADYATGATPGKVTLRRWAGGSLTSDATFTPFTTSNLIGRSATDAYFGMTTDVYHWDGTAWTALTGLNLASVSYVVTLGVGPSPDLFIGDQGISIVEFDGISGSTISTNMSLSPGSSAATPLVFQIGGNPAIVQYDQGQGWVSIAAPLPTNINALPTGPDPSHVVLFDHGTFARWNGTTWSTYSDILTEVLASSATVAWTDGTNAVAATSNGVVLCALP
jgi:hypothetical protein